MIPFHRLMASLSTRETVDTVSFDIFDTVVFRRQGSWHAFLAALGARLVEQELISGELSPEAFAELRLATERVAHQTPQANGSRALRLEEIYNFLPAEHRGARGTPENLARAEFEFELASVYGLPATIELIRALAGSGLRICFVSNSYYGRRQLIQLLSAAGVPDDYLEYVFASCEYGRGKQHGLFKDVMRDMALAPENLVHCGDNAGTDVKAPNELGIETAQYQGTLDRWLAKPKAPARLSVAESLRTSPRFDPDASPYQDFGFTVLGPIVAGFIAWLLSLAQAEGRRTLLFAEREGVFLKTAVDLVLALSNDLALERLTTRRIAVSRRAVMPLVAGSPRYLDLQTDLFARRLKFGVLDLQHQAEPEQSARVREYLAAKITDPGTSLFVDIGYKGTIAHAINAYFAERGDEALLAAYFIHAASADRPGSPARGYLPDESSRIDILPRTQKGLSFLEQCLMPPIGSVLGFDSGLAPQREPFLISDRQVAEQTAVQEGILAFLTDYIQLCDGSRIPLTEGSMPRRLAEDELLSVLREPTAGVEALAAHWMHEANFGTRQLLPVSAKSLFALVGPAMSILLGGRSWLGPLRRNMPLSLTGRGTTTSTVQILCTTDRGPIGPGSVRGVHPVSNPRVAHVLTAPEGERFRTLRLAQPSLGTSRLRVTLWVSGDTRRSDERATLEAIADDPRRTQVVISWAGADTHVVHDGARLIEACQATAGEALLTFGNELTSDAMLIVIEAQAAPTPSKRASAKENLPVSTLVQMLGARMLPETFKRPFRGDLHRRRQRRAKNGS